MGLAMLGFGQVFARRALDILLVVGDRFEVAAPIAQLRAFAESSSASPENWFTGLISWKTGTLRGSGLGATPV